MRFRKLPGWMCLCFPISTAEPVDKTYILVLWVTTTHSLVGSENLVLLSLEAIQKTKVAGFLVTQVTVCSLHVAKTQKSTS